MRRFAIAIMAMMMVISFAIPAAAAADDDETNDVVTITFKSTKDGCRLTLRGRNLRSNYTYGVSNGPGVDVFNIDTDSKGSVSASALVSGSYTVWLYLNDGSTFWNPDQLTFRGGCGSRR